MSRNPNPQMPTNTNEEPLQEARSLDDSDLQSQLGPEVREAQQRLRPLNGMPMQVAIELGRRHLKIRDLLGMQYHSVFELDRLAGSNLDICVNGILLGKGEVQVLEDRIRIKINEIVPA
ncbi:MAG: FliM/FliN family flagellar motor switch protein [Acidobacteriota bacterium]